MPDTIEKVKYLIQNIEKKPNPFFGDTIVHPHQSEKIKNSDYEFRKVPHELINYYNSWIHLSYLGCAIRQYPHLLKVFDYIKYRTLTMGREGFSFTISSILEDSDYYHAFVGDREVLYKYLNILQELGIIFIDKRLYRNYIWLNFDVIGRYPVKMITNQKVIDSFDTHELEAYERLKFITSENYITSYKKKYKIYDLNLLDDKACLEFLWLKMIGYENTYSMLPKDIKEKYLSSVDFSKKTGLKKKALEYAIENLNCEDDDYFNKFRLIEYTFKHGGYVMIDGKKEKNLKMFNIENITINEDGTITDNTPKKLITKEKLVKKIKDVEKPAHKKAANSVDWDTEDLTRLDLESINKKFAHKKSLINYFDELFIKGLNESNRAKSLNIKYERTIKVNKLRDSEDNKFAYLGIINGIYNNLYKRMINKGFDDKKIKSFIFWIGKNYFNVVNSLSWYKDKDKVIPSLMIFSNSEKTSLADSFFNFYERYLIKKFNNELIKNNYKLTKKEETVIISDDKISISKEMKEQLEQDIIEKYKDKITKEVETEMKAKMKSQTELINRKLKIYSDKLESLNVDPLDLI